jgi:hypothetical protein
MKTNQVLLIKSLKYIGNFPTQVQANADEYLKIHYRNIEELKLVAEERSSKHIVKLIGNFTPISINELNEYIEWKNKNISLFAFAYGKLIGFFVSAIKNKGNTRQMIQRKLIQNAENSTKLSKIIENPYYEDLYNQL